MADLKLDEIPSRFTHYVGRSRDVCSVCRKEDRGDVAVERTAGGLPTALCAYHATLSRNVRAELERESRSGALTPDRVKVAKDRAIAAAHSGAR